MSEAGAGNGCMETIAELRSLTLDDGYINCAIKERFGLYLTTSSVDQGQEH